MKSKILFYVVIALVIVGSAYLVYSKDGQDNNINSSQIILDLKGVLDNDTINVENDNTSTFSESQLTDDIVKILNDEITKLEGNLSQTDASEYSLDNRFTDMNVLAMRYQGLADWDKVGEIYMESLELFPERPLAWYNLATYQIKAGAWESARDNLFRSLELDSQHLPTWSTLIDLYRFQVKANFDVINSLYSLALQYTNDNNTVLRGYAEYLEQSDELELALRAWEEVYERSTDNQEVILDRINRVQSEIDEMK